MKTPNPSREAALLQPPVPSPQPHRIGFVRSNRFRDSAGSPQAVQNTPLASEIGFVPSKLDALSANVRLWFNNLMRHVRCSLIQAANAAAPDSSLEVTKQAMLDKHVAYMEDAAKAGAQIVCLQEIFYGPYFCAEQTTRWYDFTEPIPDGPTIRLMQDLAESSTSR